eukprot:7328575-Alexandrium_andersonii.AAC.1
MPSSASRWSARKVRSAGSGPSDGIACGRATASLRTAFRFPAIHRLPAASSLGMAAGPAALSITRTMRLGPRLVSVSAVTSCA